MSPPIKESLGLCQEKAGFLFAHDCPRPTAQQCIRCFKPICLQHGHSLASGETLCTTCFKHEGLTESESDPDSPQEEDDNPYLYSSYYYQDHGYYGPGSWGHDLLHDPNDFTEADGASLRAKVKHHFEEDMGGS